MTTATPRGVTTISKGKLKGRMPEYFRQVELTGEPLIVTDRGREVLEVRPLGKPRMTVAEVLVAYRCGTQPVPEIPEGELLKPLPTEEQCL